MNGAGRRQPARLPGPARPGGAGARKLRTFGHHFGGPVLGGRNACGFGPHFRGRSPVFPLSAAQPALTCRSFKGGFGVQGVADEFDFERAPSQAMGPNGARIDIPFATPSAGGRRGAPYGRSGRRRPGWNRGRPGWNTWGAPLDLGAESADVSALLVGGRPNLNEGPRFFGRPPN